MRKLSLIILLCSFLGHWALGQAKLEKLMEERESLHQQWKVSESQKSGIFGNRTKKDMIQTNDWMQRIINKDNQIMEELRMHNEIEKTTIIHEKEDYKYIAMKQEQDIAKLKRALADMEELVGETHSGQRAYEWLTVVFFLVCLTLAIFIFKKRHELFFRKKHLSAS